MTKYVAVLYAPFQTATTIEIHWRQLELIAENFPSIVIALPVRRVTPTKNAPLDFAARECMIREYIASLNPNIRQPQFYIVPVVDKKYEADQVMALETAVSALFSEPIKAVLTTYVEFAKIYKEHGGKWHVDNPVEFLAYENDHRNHIASATNSLTADYRTGVIAAMKSQFPISWGTVDMAIRRIVDGHVKFLFGKKPGEKGWRFPGGFKDTTDFDYESAVWREGGEEVLVAGVKPESVFDVPRYIISRKVNDWRYRNEIDSITTLFYTLNFTGTDDQIKAGDDLCDAAWFGLDELKPEDIEGEHIFLFRALVEDERKLHSIQNCRVCNTVLTCDCGIPEAEDVYNQTYMEDCNSCGGTGKQTSAFQTGVSTHCETCCGISKKYFRQGTL